MNASWAAWRNPMRGFARFPGMEPVLDSNCATVLEISNVCVASQQRFYGRFGTPRLPFVTSG
jgi:hypothetical protein